MKTVRELIAQHHSTTEQAEGRCECKSQRPHCLCFLCFFAAQVAGVSSISSSAAASTNDALVTLSDASVFIKRTP